jgi:hypothetical protein
MPEFIVRLSGYQDASIKVNATDYDAAIEEATTEGVPGICANCSGWNKSWWRDEGDEWTPYEVDDDTGATVWSGPTGVGETVIREFSSLYTKVAGRSAGVGQTLGLIDARIKKLQSGEL